MQHYLNRRANLDLVCSLFRCLFINLPICLFINLSKKPGESGMERAGQNKGDAQREEKCAALKGSPASGRRREAAVGVHLGIQRFSHKTPCCRAAMRLQHSWTPTRSGSLILKDCPASFRLAIFECCASLPRTNDNPVVVQLRCFRDLGGERCRQRSWPYLVEDQSNKRGLSHDSTHHREESAVPFRSGRR